MFVIVVNIFRMIVTIVVVIRDVFRRQTKKKKNEFIQNDLKLILDLQL